MPLNLQTDLPGGYPGQYGADLVVDAKTPQMLQLMGLML